MEAVAQSPALWSSDNPENLRSNAPRTEATLHEPEQRSTDNKAQQCDVAEYTSTTTGPVGTELARDTPSKERAT